MKRFHSANATSPGRALPLPDIGVHHSLIVRYLESRGVIKSAGSGRYFIDEQSEREFRQRRFRFTVTVLTVGALVALAAICAVVSLGP